MSAHNLFFVAMRAWLFLLGLAAVASGIVVREVNDDPTTSPTVTVTVTVTQPLGPPTVTLTRTSTRSVWLSSVVITENLNCTRTVFTANQAAASPSLGTPPNADTGFEVGKRQGSESPTTTTTTPVLTTIIPTSTVATPTARTRTRTVWAVTTAVQTTPYSRTNYQCAFTLAYLLTTDATTTIPYTLTRYPSTVTATSTIDCPFGLGGFGGLGGLPTTLPNAPLPTTSAALSSATGDKFKRQITNSTTIPVTTPAVSNSVRISTVHLTRTTYSIVTFNATAAATVQRYECSTSTYDTTVTYDVTRTVWPSTATVVSVLSCGLPGRPPVTSTTPTVTLPPTLPGKIKRQDEPTTSTSSAPTSLPPTSSVTETPSSSTSTSVHRTRYIFGTVTLTATVPTTRLVYSCAATTTASVQGP